jgi:hypothetical protein
VVASNDLSDGRSSTGARIDLRSIVEISDLIGNIAHQRVSRPSSAMRSNSALWSKRTISTSQSTAAPAPPERARPRSG